MDNYSKISNNKCINCDGKLKNISDLNKDKKQCKKCNTIYTHSDDMGPGCWHSKKQKISRTKQ